MSRCRSRPFACKPGLFFVFIYIILWRILLRLFWHGTIQQSSISQVWFYNRFIILWRILLRIRVLWRILLRIRVYFYNALAYTTTHKPEYFLFFLQCMCEKKIQWRIKKKYNGVYCVHDNVCVNMCMPPATKNKKRPAYMTMRLENLGTRRIYIPTYVRAYGVCVYVYWGLKPSPTPHIPQITYVVVSKET